MADEHEVGIVQGTSVAETPQDHHDDDEYALFQQLQGALQDQGAANDTSGLGVDDQLLVDSLRSVISGEAYPPESTSNDAIDPLMGMIDSATDEETLQAVQNALRELGNSAPMRSDTLQRRLSNRFRRRPQMMTDEDRDRIRHENRNRKRKWRDTNYSRNKDNDLRARIYKKAVMIFGEHDSPQKSDYIEREYLKRRERRFMREGSERAKRHFGTLLGSEDMSGTRLFELFRQSNSVFDPKHSSLLPDHMLSPLVPAPERPAFFHSYVPRPANSSTYLLTADSVSFGFPPALAAIAESFLPKPKPKEKPQQKEPLNKTVKRPVSIYEKFNLPTIDEAVLGNAPLPPLPKSVLDHQRKMMERKEQEQKQNAEKERAREEQTTASSAEVSKSPQVPDQELSETAPPGANSNADETSQEHGDHEVGQLTDAQALALEHALENPHNFDHNIDRELEQQALQDLGLEDPSQAIRELQMALEQQGLMGINLDLELGANADHDQSQEDGANSDTGDVVSDIQVLKVALAGGPQTDASDSDNGTNVSNQGNVSESVDASSASQESSEARNEEPSQLKVESE